MNHSFHLQIFHFIPKYSTTNAVKKQKKKPNNSLLLHSTKLTFGIHKKKFKNVLTMYTRALSITITSMSTSGLSLLPRIFLKVFFLSSSNPAFKFPTFRKWILSNQGIHGIKINTLCKSNTSQGWKDVCFKKIGSSTPFFFKQASLRLLNVRQQLCCPLWRSRTCLWFFNMFCIVCVIRHYLGYITSNGYLFMGRILRFKLC